MTSTELSFIEVCRVVCDRFSFGFSALLKLRTKGFREGITIWYELAQIDLISSHHMLRETLDLQLHLRLANLFLAARFVQIAESFAAGAQLGLQVVDFR